MQSGGEWRAGRVGVWAYGHALGSVYEWDLWDTWD